MNNNFNGLLKIIVITVIALLGLSIAWGAFSNKVNNNSQNIEKIEVKVNKNVENISIIKSDIRELKVGQKHISKGIDDIKKKLQGKYDARSRN